MKLQLPLALRRIVRSNQEGRPGHLSLFWKIARTAMNGVTWFGVGALTFMMVMYALERRDPRFILAFALGCALSGTYGFLAGVWPFGVVEAVWCLVAIRRFAEARQLRDE